MIAQFLLVPVTCKSFPSSTTDWEKAPLGEGEGGLKKKATSSTTNDLIIHKDKNEKIWENAAQIKGEGG